MKKKTTSPFYAVVLVSLSFFALTRSMSQNILQFWESFSDLTEC